MVLLVVVASVWLGWVRVSVLEVGEVSLDPVVVEWVLNEIVVDFAEPEVILEAAEPLDPGALPVLTVL